MRRKLTEWSKMSREAVDYLSSRKLDSKTNEYTHQVRGRGIWSFPKHPNFSRKNPSWGRIFRSSPNLLTTRMKNSALHRKLPCMDYMNHMWSRPRHKPLQRSQSFPDSARSKSQFSLSLAHFENSNQPKSAFFPMPLPPRKSSNTMMKYPTDQFHFLDNVLASSLCELPRISRPHGCDFHLRKHE